MQIAELIQKKKQGDQLARDEIMTLIAEYTQGSIPDHQMAALIMAIWFRGMSRDETLALTLAMVNSGETVSLDPVAGIKVDKHSTGGVGDKTTLVLGPLVAAAGLPVAKMSGRSLGHTGGTIDKLESIPGFCARLHREQFVRAVEEVGIAVSEQTRKLVPADGKLYALRDATATVDSLPLIAASIMSKKIASGADALMLDVKTGGGALVPEVEQSLELASMMVDIGCAAERPTFAAITDMSQPLGRCVGNALEVKEAIKTLKGKGSEDLRELCLFLGSHMLSLGGRTSDLAEGRRYLEGLLTDGGALAKFAEFIEHQGGNRHIVEDTSLMPTAGIVTEVPSPLGGYINQIGAREIGSIAKELSAGRDTEGSIVDPAAGVILNKKVGDRVSPGELLAELHSGKNVDGHTLHDLRNRTIEAFNIDEGRASPSRLIRAFVTREGIRHYGNDTPEH